MSSNIPNGMTNEHGQGASHAKDSSVPGVVQDKAPSSVEHKLPDRHVTLTTFFIFITN